MTRRFGSSAVLALCGLALAGALASGWVFLHDSLWHALGGNGDSAPRIWIAW